MVRLQRGMCQKTQGPCTGQERDIELINQARGGNAWALDLLAVRYGCLVERQVSRFCIRGVEPEDLEQEGMIGFIGAVKAFRPELGVSFHTYAVRCIKTKIVSAIRTAQRKKQQPLNGSISLDDASVLGRAAFCNVIDPEDMVLDREAVNAVYEEIHRKLTPQERRVLAFRVAGDSYADMARKLHVETKYIDNTLQKVKRKLGLGAIV